MEDIKTRIKAMLVERLFLPVEPSQIGDSESLAEKYGVDSVALFDIAVGLEDEFGLSMSDEVFAPERFRDVNSIAQLVQSKS